MASEHHLAAFKLRRHGQLEPRVSVWTCVSGRTKAGQVVETEDASNVSVSTGRAVSAEASVVPGTVSDLCFRVDV